MPRTLLLVLVLALLFPAPGTAQPAEDVDESFLRGVGLASDTDTLLEFFRHRSLEKVTRSRLEALGRLLADPQEPQRDQAQKELLLFGPLAVPFLKEIENHPQAEVQQRIGKCLSDIEASKGPEVPAAATRILARRQAPAALEALLNYLPRMDEDLGRDEILASLVALALRPGKVDPLLLAALKSPEPVRRAAAVYVLGRRGGVEERATVRLFLADPDPLVRQRAAEGLLGKRAFFSLSELASADEQLLRQHGVGTDESSLFAFLRKRSLTEPDQEQLRQLVRQLGDVSYVVRQKAAHQLLTFHTPALAFLKPARDDVDPETARRASQLIDEIQRGPGPALPAAVVRLLARPQTLSGPALALALRVLLDYLPFAEDESVEEEALTVLAALSLREVKVDPQLLAALRDPMAARRGAAAHALGRVGTSEHCQAVRKLLDDPSAWVRLRAAQGLIAARDKSAVPRLIALLRDTPAGTVWQVEEILHRLAGDQPAADIVGDSSPEARQKAVRAWQKWWQEKRLSLDLASLSDSDQYLGLTTICEYDSGAGRAGGQVWECGRDGKPRWRLRDLMGPMDAQALPNGRVLVAENSGQKVTERDLSGHIKWHYQVQGNPIACQRLPDGNTFIATYNQVLEVTPSHEVKYSINRGPGFYIFSARKLRNHHIVCITAQGMIVEFEAPSGKEIRSFSIGQTGGWCSVEALPNGRYLVATMANGQVRELDATGKSHWQCQFQGAFRATRLPNGHTLVASMTTRKIAEFDRAGQLRWERPCEGRPWSLRYR